MQDRKNTLWHGRLIPVRAFCLTSSRRIRMMIKEMWNNGRQLRCIHKGEFGTVGYDENTTDETGTPTAMASASTRPKPSSCREARTKASTPS